MATEAGIFGSTPIDERLRKTLMTYACPHCGHRLQKLGDWFYSTHQYICTSCKKGVLLGYSVKLKLFADHAQQERRNALSGDSGQA